MKNRVVGVFSLLLAGLLLLAGCSQAGGSGSNPTDISGNALLPGGDPASITGMFVQSIVGPQLDMEVRFSGLHQWEDDTLLLSGMDETLAPHAFTGDGMGEWEELKNETAVSFMLTQREAGNYPTFTVTPDGTWWFAVSEHLTGMPGEIEDGPADLPPPKLVKIAAGGAPQEFEVQPDDAQLGEHYAVNVIVPGPGSIVYFLLTENISYTRSYWAAFDGASDKLVFKIPVDQQNQSAYDAIFKEGRMYLPNTANSQLDVYDMQNGKKVESITILALNFGWESVCIDIAENGDFCYADNAGIHRVAKGGTLVQDMVSGTRFVFSAPEYMGSDLVALPDDSYLLLATDSMSTDQLYRFEFDANATIGADDILSVWALQENHVLRAAIAEYNKANPDVYVMVEYGRTADATGATDEDIIRTLNTRLITGDVPDVLILDGLPADTYISRGMLADLTGFVDTAGLYENIMQTYTREGKAYGYPALFQMPLFMTKADDTRVAGIAGLDELADIATEPDALHYGSYAEMFESIYMAYGARIFPGAKEVDEASLRDFLENTAAISATLQLTNENSYIHGGMGNSGVLPRQGLYSFIETSSRYAADILWEPIAVSVMFSFGGAKALSPLPGGSFIPFCAGAIPEGAVHPDKAAAFIELMLHNEQVQSLHMDQGFSVVKGLDTAYLAQSAQRNGITGEASPGNIDWDGLVASFSGPAITERVLYLKLYEQAERLYRDEIALDDAVANVVKNTKIYFEERA